MGPLSRRLSAVRAIADEPSRRVDCLHRAQDAVTDLRGADDSRLGIAAPGRRRGLLPRSRRRRDATSRACPHRYQNRGQRVCRRPDVVAPGSEDCPAQRSRNRERQHRCAALLQPRLLPDAAAAERWTPTILIQLKEKHRPTAMYEDSIRHDLAREFPRRYDVLPGRRHHRASFELRALVCNRRPGLRQRSDSGLRNRRAAGEADAQHPGCGRSADLATRLSSEVDVDRNKALELGITENQAASRAYSPR